MNVENWDWGQAIPFCFKFSVLVLCSVEVDGMKVHKEKYSRDSIPYNLPELFQGCEKLEKFNRMRTRHLYHPDQVC
jgi:hypothetical protein